MLNLGRRHGHNRMENTISFFKMSFKISHKTRLSIRRCLNSLQALATCLTAAEWSISKKLGYFETQFELWFLVTYQISLILGKLKYDLFTKEYRAHFTRSKQNWITELTLSWRASFVFQCWVSEIQPQAGLL